MSHPPILIVDKNDKPAGRASYSEIGKKGLIRRIARIMLVNSKGQVLLQKRSDDVLVYPGKWDNSTSGHVDAGETTLQAAEREMKEEIGVEGVELEFVGKYYNEVNDETGKVRKFNHYFKGQIEETPADLNEEEVSRVKWFGVEELKKLIHDNPDDFTDGVVEVVRRFYR